jgi:hypothetical protein
MSHCISRISTRVNPPKVPHPWRFFFERIHRRLRRYILEVAAYLLCKALSEYDTKDQMDVRFANGSSEISEADQQALVQLAHNAVNLTG